jgi:hypothetical protein
MYMYDPFVMHVSAMETPFISPGMLSGSLCVGCAGIDPSEERRFHCSNVAEGSSKSCTGASQIRIQSVHEEFITVDPR